jgi:hypothetical protein
MFNWYGDAEVCYAYLQDIPKGLSLDHQLKLFATCRWFTRGWTLQELIAPSSVVFFDSDWSEIGTRSTLVSTISHTTGIHRELFTDGHLSTNFRGTRSVLDQYSVAQKMSWAAHRTTSRVEDEAYCLLGLFGVNLPLLYGEGRMSFIRFQEELMKRSSDTSIFAWNPDLGESGTFGFLAYAPACFQGLGDIIQKPNGYELPPYGITNKGIQITLPILDPAWTFEDHTEIKAVAGIRFVLTGTESHLAVLNCAHSSSKDSLIGVLLDEQYRRTGRLRTVNATTVAQKAQSRTIFLQLGPNIEAGGNKWLRKSEEWPLVFVRQNLSSQCEFSYLKSWPREVQWRTQESEVLFARFAGHQTSYLFFGNDLLAFCLMISFERTTVQARIIEDVPEDMRESNWDPWQWEDRQIEKMSKFSTSSEDTRCGNNIVSVSATGRPFGAVVELTVQSHEPQF